MKTAYHSSTGFRTLSWIGFFLVGLTVISSGQENRASLHNGGEQAGNPKRDFKIQIGVNEVRLDAVVLDKDGHQVTDLTADDFEIHQDGSLQKITSCTYINDYVPQPGLQAGAAPDSKTMLSLPTPAPTLENVRRTIAFVVDNLSMSFDQMHSARTALQKFVEAQMQPGDLVTIVPTAGGNAALQVFSSDRRHLLRMIDNLRWFIDTRATLVLPQYMALSYCIRALRDMPGRKTLITISPETMIPGLLVDDIGRFSSPLKARAPLARDAFNPLADAALRAGVVIHTLDIHGLEGPGVYDSDFGADRSFPVDVSEGIGLSDRWTPDAAPERYIENRTRRIRWAAAMRDSETRIPLSEKTGGLFVKDFNWFANGIGAVNEQLKGYYMLTYTPPGKTFSPDLKNTYRRIKIKVKRPKCEVHSRDGFFGIPQPAYSPAEDSGSLRAAIFSPFQYSDLHVHLASGYVEDARRGYLLQSWLHLEGKDLTVLEGKEGGPSILLEAACVTSDMNNVIQDSNVRQYAFSIKEQEIPWVKENGLRFSLILPVKNPGAYYVRTAVKDMRSGKMGSAYQFIEVPDLKNRRLSLSNIFFINREEDAPWAQSAAPQESQNLLYPDMRRDPRKSPALRSYLPGEAFECAAVIYNAEADKDQKPELETQYVLFANGKELFRSKPETVRLEGMSDFKRIPVRKELTLGNSLQPGDYVLLLQVQDKRDKKKRSAATQALDFKVLAK
jgi:VWFA-related protein